MKKIILLTALCTSSLLASDNSDKVLSNAKKNIIATLWGVNENLQFQAIQTLRELKYQNPGFNAEEALPALINILEEHRNYSVRIMAALAIAEIGSASPALKAAADRDSNKTVRNICSGLSK